MTGNPTRVLSALLGALVSVSVCAAPTVMVMSLGQDRADLVINGTVIRTLRSGETSPEGVRLISANRAEALIEIEGRQLVKYEIL